MMQLIGCSPPPPRRKRKKRKEKGTIGVSKFLIQGYKMVHIMIMQDLQRGKFSPAVLILQAVGRDTKFVFHLM